MTLLFPIKADAAATSTANWKLCEYLKKYIEKKKGQAELSRKSDNAPEVNPLVLKASVSPDVYIQFSTGFTGDGYNIEAANYSALVGALNYELWLYYSKPSIQGTTINNEDCFIGTSNDIVVNLPPTTDEEELEMLAQRLAEGAFWPPIKTKTPKDTPGNLDPYFLRFSSKNTWAPETSTFAEGQDISQCSGEIKTDDSKHINYLEIVGVFPKEKYGPEIPDPTDTTDYPVQHYTWSIPVSDAAEGAKQLILTVKGTNATLYVKVGAKGAAYDPSETPTEYVEYTKLINTTDFTTLDPIDVSRVTPKTLEVGIIGAGTIDITAVWYTPATTEYNILPQGYRSIEQEVETEVPASPCLALTSKSTLEDRDSEKVELEPQPTEETTSDSPTGGSAVDSPAGFSSALSGILGQITSTADTDLKIIDLNSVMKLDTSAMQTKIANAASFASKLEFSKAKDKLEAVKAGAEQQAQALIVNAKDKVKGKNISLSPTKLEAVKSKVGGLLSKAKSASAEATAGLNNIKAQATAQADAVKKNADQLTTGLQNQVKAAQSSAASKLSAAKAKADTVKQAVDTAKASAADKATAAAKSALKG